MTSIEITARVAQALDDVVGILAVSGELLDWTYLFGWADRHGTAELLRQLADSANELS